MQEFIFSFEPLGFELSIVAESEKKARQLVWLNLPDGYKDHCESFDLVEINPLDSVPTQPNQ